MGVVDDQERRGEERREMRMRRQGCLAGVLRHASSPADLRPTRGSWGAAEGEGRGR